MGLPDSLADWQSRVSTLQSITQSLKALAQRNQDTELARNVAALTIVVGGMSGLLKQEAASFTLTTQGYADREGISQRSAQRLCNSQKLPAIRVGTEWRIKDETYCESA